MAKQINTRICLKYDTYANWTSTTLGTDKGANFVLKKGEIGLCEVPSNNGAATTAPTVLFKVGDGTSKFSALNWVSALAADVYSWAKASDVVYDGQHIKFKNGNTVIKDLDLSEFITSTELETALGSYALSSDLGTAATKNVEYFATADQGAKADSAIQSVSIATGTANGKIKLTVDGSATEASVYGLGSAAYTNSSDYAPADIDTGVHSVSLASGATNGTVKLTVDGVAGDDVKVTGLGSAAYTNSTAYATAEQGTKADNAVSTETFEAFKTSNTAAIATAKEGAETTAANELANARTEITKEIDDAIKASGSAEGGVIYEVKQNVATAQAKAEEGVSKAEAAQIAADAAQKTIDDFLTSEEVDATVNTLKEIQTELEKLGDTTEIMTAIAAKADKTITVTGTDGLTGGGDLTANRTIGIAANGVTTAKIADKNVTAAKLADDAKALFDAAGTAQGLINGLDVIAVTVGAGETVSSVSQTDGKISVLKQAIEITASQVSDFNSKVAAVKVTNAASADSATKATQDADGNNIIDTYATKAQLTALDYTATGMGAGKTIAALTETDGKIAATFQDIEITTSQISDFDEKVADIKVDNATHAASADTATKATQDADGNVITTTYATKAEVAALTTDDIEGGTETWIFNCGTASTVI